MPSGKCSPPLRGAKDPGSCSARLVCAGARLATVARALLWRRPSCVRWVSSSARPAGRRFVSPSAPGLCAASATPSAGRQSPRPGRPARARTTSVTGWWGKRWGESTARGAGRLRSPPDPDPGRGPPPRGCARVLSPGRWTRPAPARGGRQRRGPWRPRSPGRQVRLACQAVGLWICTERAGWVPESVPDSGLLLFTVGTPGMMGTGMAALFLRNGSDPYTE